MAGENIETFAEWSTVVGDQTLPPPSDDAFKLFVLEALAALYNRQGMENPVHDYLVIAYPDTVTDVVTFKVGGAAGTVVGTKTVVYTDATRAKVYTVTWS